MPAAPLVSIIVPVLNDGAELDRLLRSFSPSPGVELIVAHAGLSEEPIRALPGGSPGVRFTESGIGRGIQMNQGAAIARGRWLLFLHVDCRLGEGWLEALEHADRPGIVGGSFRFVLDSPARPARVVERGVAWRVRWLGLPYGDQALFVRRDVFAALGGYRSIPLMEDVDLVRRLGRVGRLEHSAVPVIVSARRWERDGWYRRTGANLLLLGLYFGGMKPARLARMYYGDRIERRRASREQHVHDSGRRTPQD